uniref:DUF7775 domain-containing protein n=1 Tax=Glossina pallidipes TaxID=7398 RepID=A0A1B0A861_GLOPL
MKSMSSSPPADKINSLIMPKACGRQCLNLTNSCTHLAPPQSRKTLALLLLPASKIVKASKTCLPKTSGKFSAPSSQITAFSLSLLVMQLTWCLFKAFEAALSALCLAIHTKSINQKQPIPHVVIFHGTFFGFMLLSGFGCLVVFFNRGTNAINECYTTAPILRQLQEAGVCGLITAIIFLIHAFFAFDMALVHGPEIANEDNENYEANTALLKFRYNANRRPRYEEGNMFSFSLKNSSQNSLARNLYDLDYYNDVSISLVFKSWFLDK